MNSASTSTVSLIPSSHPSSSKPKNYEQAFGSLSSSFGFAGSVVSVPRVQNTSLKSNSSSNRSSSWRKHPSSFFSPAEKRKKDLGVAAQQEQQQQATAAYWANAQSLSQSQSEKKNFEAAYGDLASRYGSGGGPKSDRV